MGGSRVFVEGTHKTVIQRGDFLCIARCMDTTTSNKGLDPIAEFVIGVYGRWKEKRDSSGETEKWKKNRDAARNALSGKWRKQEGEGDYSQNESFDFTRQKIRAAVALGVSSAFKDNELQCGLADPDVDLFELDAGDALREELEADPEARQRKEREENEARDRAEQWYRFVVNKLGFVREFKKCFKSFLICGRCWRKTAMRSGGVDTWQNHLGRLLPATITFSAPAPEYIPVQRMYWDMDKPWGEGDGCIEIDMLSAFELAEEARNAGEIYSAEMVKKVLSEAKERNAGGGNMPQYDLTLYNGEEGTAETNENRKIAWMGGQLRIPRKLLERFESGVDEESSTDPEELGHDADLVKVYVVIAGGRTLCARETEIEIYDTTVYESILDDERSTGVADLCETTQRVLDGTFRALDDGMKNVSKMTVAVLDEMFKDSDVTEEKGVTFVRLKGSGVRDIGSAFQQMQLNAPIGELMNYMKLGIEMGDMQSGIPQSEQGLQADRAEPGYALEMRLNKSGMLVAMTMLLFNDFIEKQLQTTWKHLNQDEDNPYRGNYIARAHAFSMYNRYAIKTRRLLQAVEFFAGHNESARRLNWEYIDRELGEAMDINTGKMFLPEVIVEARAKAEAESAERLMEIEAAKMELEKMKAEIELTQAKAVSIGDKDVMARAESVKKLRE